MDKINLLTGHYAIKYNNGVPVARRDIRLQYSGFVVFAAKLLSIITGLIFQFMIARSIPGNSPEYGIWFNVNDVLAYFTLLAGVIPFWVMRCVAREKAGAAKTGFTTNLLIAIISTIAYLALAPFILSALGIAADYLVLYLVASLQIVELYIMNVFESCLQAYAPQKIGYGTIVQQATKVILGYVLIIQLGQPLMGAVVSLSVAMAVQLSYYYTLLASELKQRIRWSYVKEWLKASVVNIYNVVGNQVAAFVFIMLFYYGGAGGREIYGAATQIANVITYAGFLAFALYPKLLAEKKSEDITSSLKTVLMFALPMTAGAVVLSNSYMILLRENLLRSYPGAAAVLVVLAFDALVTVVSGIYGAALLGVETVDQEKTSLRTMVKSKLFLFFSLPFLHSAITIPTTYYVLTAYTLEQPLQAAFSVCVINSVVRFAMFLLLVIIVRKMITITIPWRSTSKYIFASAIMGIVLFLLPYSSRISTTLAWTAVGGIIYVTVLMVIDKEARGLPKTILQEIKGKNNRNA